MSAQEEEAVWPRCSRCGIIAQPGAACLDPRVGRCPWVLDANGEIADPRRVFDLEHQG